MTAPRIGSWARAGALVGIVAAVDGEIAVFDPGARQVTRVPLDDVTPLPAGAVRVTLTVDLPLPHGLDESDLRRWVAALADDVLRERALAALAEAGLDEGAALPGVSLSVAPLDGALCLAGHRVPSPAGASLACPSCGREAVGAPVADR